MSRKIDVELAEFDKREEAKVVDHYESCERCGAIGECAYYGRQYVCDTCYNALVRALAGTR